MYGNFIIYKDSLYFDIPGMSWHAGQPQIEHAAVAAIVSAIFDLVSYRCCWRVTRLRL